MAYSIRPYREDDFDAVVRIWREVGWIEDSDEHKELTSIFLSAGSADVALVDGDAECLVHRAPGAIHYGGRPLPLCAITAVTTSLVGRRQGFASALTSRALQAGHAERAAVAALGMFEQGFYDRFGFATASYEHELSFDPSTLDVGHVPYRVPVRVGLDDAVDFHQAMLRRWRGHGAIDLEPPELQRAEMGWAENFVGLGYRGEDGSITHGFWGSTSGEYGPLRVTAVAYQTREQMIELLRLIRELGDQIRTVKMIEPAHVQLQALITEPMRQRDRSRATKHESGSRAVAWMQLRMLDVAACVAARSWVGRPVTFNLTLTDPLAEHVTEGWSGVGGDYTVTVGETSSATPGHQAGAPLLHADVGAFTRLWFGVGQATTLLSTDNIEGPADLLAELDDALLLPPLRPGWDF